MLLGYDSLFHCGMRLFAHGKIEKAWKHDGLGIEVYGTGRYLTITGQQVPGTPRAIAAAPKTLQRLIGLVASAREQARPDFARAVHVGGDFFRAVNAIALTRLVSWVPRLFPKARRYDTGAWRVTSADLSRNLQEDLSIHPDGIHDFGLENRVPPSTC